MKSFDVLVIGGGIVGLAHALAAAKRDLKVLLLERDAYAQGATVRNFGMVWPIGQPAGELHDAAMESRQTWLELSREDALPVEECGSIHLAYRDDEYAVLREFASAGTHAVELLGPEEIATRAPFVKQDKLQGGLWSDTEVRVDPRVAAASLTRWLMEKRLVTTVFGCPIVRVSDHAVHASGGQSWQAEKIIICSGSDFETLYPEAIQNSGLKRCKLQMLQAESLSNIPRPAPHIASGLTLRHYRSFEHCPSLARLCERIRHETPELDKYGIHVMASAFPDGRVILGDSHEYDSDISPFDNPEIDDLILRELSMMLPVDDWKITQRWHGIYAKHEQLPVYQETVDEDVEIFLGTGGAGMTLSFGLAERAWSHWSQPA